jgi:hypothetical protein
MANVTLKLSIGTFSAEVSGPEKYAEKKLEDLIAKYLSGSVKTSASDSSSSSASLPVQGTDGEVRGLSAEVICQRPRARAPAPHRLTVG